MRAALILPLSLLLVSFHRPAQGAPLEAYSRAQAAESTLDADRVASLWAEARGEALDAGDGHLALITGYRQALLLHNLQRTSDALQAVEETLAGYDQATTAGESWTLDLDSKRLRTELLFLLDRCLSESGRVADGWTALRQAASAIRHRPTNSPAAASDPLTARSFDGWTSTERALAWRTIAREAEYLDLTGHTLDALALLDRTAPRAVAAATEATADEYERAYADKVALNRTLLLDFLGWSERALAEQKELMERLRRRGRDRSYWVARINYLRNLAQWEGPSAETLAAAREAAIHLRPRGGGRTRADQMVARMERDLARTAESRDQLRADAEHFREAGFEEGAQWADRDALVAEAEDTNAPGLDPQFARLLAQLRLRGQKRGEPTLYREYAHYLVRQDRPDEAIPLFLEAIRLTRSFGWTLHLPALYTALASAHLDAGNPEAAAAVWEEVDRLLAEIPEIPLVRRVHTEMARALYEARLGRLEAARLTLATAKTLADQAGLPKFQRPAITEAELDDALASARNTTRTPKTGHDAITSDLQPLSIRSEGPADLTLRARFVLTNTSGLPLTGLLHADGPGLRWPRDPADESFVIEVTGGADSSVSGPLTLDPGEQIVLTTSAAAGVKGEVALEWRTGDVRQSSRWSFERSDTRREDAVLNASALRRNGFYVQSVSHQITRAEVTPGALPFRLRSSDPVRLEYYHDGRLIGVDANGDGDFAQPGDMLPPAGEPRAAHGAPTAAPMAAFAPDEQETEIEVYFFNTAATNPAPPEITLEAEVFTGGTWQPFARDVLQNVSP
jgi:tetratricopeptide (TPR) repeat protein